MRNRCQRGAILSSILWVISLAASGQTTPVIPTGRTAAATPVGSAVPGTPPDVSLYKLKNSLSLDSTAAAAAAKVAPNLPAADAPRSDQSDASRHANARPDEQPSNFQRFVQQATGRSLPIYGQQLFSAPSGYVPISQAVVPNSYILGPGDEIRLQVWGSIDSDMSLVINRHGQIYLPKVGTINLTGVRADDLE